MHIFNFEKYYFISEFDTNLINVQDKKTNIIYRNYNKKLDIQNFDMNKETVKKGTASELKRIFGKSMANRLVSRVVLNKFIQEVA